MAEYEEEVMSLDAPMTEYLPVKVRSSPYDYDLFVIGGGSGGLSAAKEAAKLGAKVGLADFVKPTPQGTTWGLGGTCVNVGCIPKKMMHFAGQFGEFYEDEIETGWALPPQKTHNWQRMVKNVQEHIQGLNWGYKLSLVDNHVTYFNNYASFVDPHTVKLTNAQGAEVKRLTSEKFLIAVGLRPSFGGLPGAEQCCFTSDDLFSMPEIKEPVLVIGASYISLECAGFLHSLGKDVTVMVRSIFLRGFDTEMSSMVGEYMEAVGVKFLRSAYPAGFERTPSGSVLVHYTQEDASKTGEYASVLLAIGRHAVTDGINLNAAGVITNPKNKKVIVDEFERSNVPHIWAIGDCADVRLELTPVAIKAGVYLAKRLFEEGRVKMDYINVPTTVFTPLEYGCVGYSEEAAYEIYGKDDVEVYHSSFTPLEWNFLEKRKNHRSFAKLICLKSQHELIIGAHYLGPHAGEVIQGIAVAVKAGATKEVFDMTVGIHPTCAEEFTTLKVTKASGANAAKTGC